MQASCPQCQQKIVIDDAKVPDRAFSVKCPKCQTVVKFPGRAAAPPPPPVEEVVDDWTSPPAAEPSSLPALQANARTLGQGQRAVVALTDRQLAATVAATIGQLGFGVDTLDNPDEGARLVEQGVYTHAVTALGGGVPGKETLLQRVARLSPDSRRRVFLTVLGEEFKTGDGIQAWAITADLVVNPRDASAFAGVLANTIGERTRVYQAFHDSRRRFEESSAS